MNIYVHTEKLLCVGLCEKKFLRTKKLSNYKEKEVWLFLALFGNFWIIHHGYLSFSENDRTPYAGNVLNWSIG